MLASIYAHFILLAALISEEKVIKNTDLKRSFKKKRKAKYALPKLHHSEGNFGKVFGKTFRQFFPSMASRPLGFVLF